MPLFFVDKINKDTAPLGTVEIFGDDARHISRSLRMAVGDNITVSAADGYFYRCTLTRIRDELCTAEIKEIEPSYAESPVEITLYMAYPKSDKLETVIQKAAELGVTKIVPFHSSRCIKRPSEEGAEKRLARLNRIAKEACGQCGRASLAKVCRPISFDGVIAEAGGFDMTLFCYEGEGTLPLKQIMENNRGAKTIAVIVGSEGGFSPEEAELAVAAGLSMTGLGGRILRCETAPLYVLSAISYVFEL